MKRNKRVDKHYRRSREGEPTGEGFSKISGTLICLKGFSALAVFFLLDGVSHGWLATVRVQWRRPATCVTHVKLVRAHFYRPKGVRHFFLTDTFTEILD